MCADRQLTLRLLFLPYLLGVLDVLVTLYYQPVEYWRGDYSHAMDGNPFVLIALRIHPLLMVPGTLVWFAIGWFLLCYTAGWIALRSYVVLLCGHTLGAGGWLLRYHPQGALLCVGLAVLVISAGLWSIRPYFHCWSSGQTLRRTGSA